jgi:hypothetical protein
MQLKVMTAKYEYKEDELIGPGIKYSQQTPKQIEKDWQVVDKKDDEEKMRASESKIK